MASAAYFYDHTMLPDRSVEDIETAWIRAQGFIQQHIVLPLKQDGWETEVDSQVNGGALKGAAYAQRQTFFKDAQGDTMSIVIPASIRDLLDAQNQTFWDVQFNFDEAQIHIHDDDTLTSDLPCIVDYIHLLQIILPGYLTLVCDEGTLKPAIRRILPGVKWVEKRRAILTEILGGAEHYDEMLWAAQDHTRACKDFAPADAYDNYDEAYEEWDSDGKASDGYSGEGPGMDFAACSQECGYCGRCDY
ncbi:hypothetical protein BDZ89DRAFT_1083124 [Hymenopellis radicata]|nr:hypothetical protein BDZ89DRAFT_1083124 [Hymenopellis radicata]